MERGRPAHATSEIGGLQPVRFLLCGAAGCAVLADLLPPQGGVEAFPFEQLGLTAGFHNASPLQDVDAIGVQDRGQAVRNQVRQPEDITSPIKN